MSGAVQKYDGYPCCLTAKEFLVSGLMWVLAGQSGFLPLLKNMHVRLNDESKLTLGVKASVDGCLTHLSLCDAVIKWQPVGSRGRKLP